MKETITDADILAVAHEIFEPMPAILSPGALKQFDEMAKKEYLKRTTMKVKFKKLHEGARLPEKATEGSAAYDLYVPEDTIVKFERQIISLGFAMEMETGYEALIDPRSGFSSKGMEGHPYGDTICLMNGSQVHSPGMQMGKARFDCDVLQGKIDSDYRGSVGVIINNRSGSRFVIKAGTRIAQMTFHKVETVQWEETEELSETNREGGFGSTGTK